MRFVVLFLALFLVEPSHAREAPNLAFVSEYIRELGVNERMRALGEREVTAVDANSRFPAIIRSSTRIQSELGAQIRTLSGIHLKPPFEDLTTKITKFYNMKIESRAERQRLLVVLSLHFGQKMDLENQSYIVSSASVLKSYLLKYKCSDEP